MSNNTAQQVTFSVVIPTYNSAGTIVRAIDSVIGQSYPAIEVIVVDDASTDNTVTVVQEHYGNRVKVIQKIVNQGGGAARNIGMDAARGTYISFLDADDAWHTDKLAVMENILSAKPGIEFLYHPFTYDDLSKKALPPDITLYKLPYVKLLPGNIIATPCATIRNRKEYRFEPTMRHTEDYDLWLRIGYKHKIYFIQIPLTQLFRPVLSKGGASENKWKMRKGEMRAYRRLVSLNPLFALLLPFLLVSSIGKHAYKMVSRQ